MRTAFIIVLLAIVGVAQPLRGADDMRRLLVRNDSVILPIFLYQELNNRLDMLDYYDAKMDNPVYDTTGGALVRITDLTDRKVTFEVDTMMKVDIYLVTPGTDSLAVTVVPVAIGAGDNAVYVNDLKTGEIVQKINIDYSEWLAKDALDRFSDGTLTAAIPYVTATVDVDPFTGVITFTNTAVTVPGIDPEIASVFKPTLQLRRKGKRYSL